MSPTFWFKRLVLAFCAAAALLLLVELAKGRALRPAAEFAALWGGAFAVLFTLIGYIRFRRSPACMLPAQKRE